MVEISLKTLGTLAVSPSLTGKFPLTHHTPHRFPDTATALRDLDTSFEVDFVHRVRFCRDVFDPNNTVLRDVIGDETDTPRQFLAAVDAGVARAWPNLIANIRTYADAHHDLINLAEPTLVVAGGEQAKNAWDVYQSVARAINDASIDRQSYVLAIGGGAMLDAVGFAAATAHRGVRLIRMPTTVLAQDDAGVGVKNGINAFGKKNFLGTFSPPWAVINDEQFLTTLSDRDWRAGFSEAVKVALIKDSHFFSEIAAAASRLIRRDQDVGRPIIQRCAALHVQHIVSGGDPFELARARPLDFGHWAAHKLEQITDFDLRHGEAVAIGIALDCHYAANIGLFDSAEADRVIECLKALGFVLAHNALAETQTLLDGLEQFREHLGGQLTITLPSQIGQGRDVHEIDREVMIRSINELRASMDNR